MGYIMKRGILPLILCLSLLLTGIPAVRAEEKPVQILLIGTDRRPGEEGCRSDTIMLCTYHKQSGKLVLTSFLRDLYLPIPGHGSNRINAAYAMGGRVLLDKTLEHNFGLEIDGNVEVDFTRFSRIIDALGGVTIFLRQDEAAYINRECGGSLAQGSARLNGEEALCYARIRSLDPDGDFSRTRRQQNLLRAMLESWKQADLSDILRTAHALLPLISTDLQVKQMIDWILSASPGLAELEVTGLRIPGEGTYRNEKVNGMDVLVPDMDKNNELVHKNIKNP